MTDPRPALVGNAGDEEQVQKAEKRIRLQKYSAAKDLGWLLQQPQFLRFLKDLLAFIGPHRTPFGEDDRHTNLNIGRQEVGRYLIKQCEDVAPDAYPRAMIAAAQQQESA